MYKTDIEIAKEAVMKPIGEVAEKLGITSDELELYGKYKAKLSDELWDRVKNNEDGKLILVTAINPTPAGEGKTTVTVGLGEAFNRLNKKAVIALREPSLGPCFGIKGGAAGGGYAQVVPMEDLNLHFTGDFHAITSANNLLAALLDNHIKQGNTLGIDTNQIVWKRCLDMNDRVLRNVGSMAALLKDAIKPNLIQTLENSPAIVHGGPFANIAHGCNSVRATKTALKLADYVITEAGFGADLGAEKFFDIKCRMAGLKPAAVVLVATIRALKYNGGVDKKELGNENVEALKKGIVNLEKHIENLKQYGVPVVVTLNKFVSDTETELEFVKSFCEERDCDFELAEVWEKGGLGGEELAKKIINTIETKESNYAPIYSDELSIKEKIEAICTKIYGADGVDFAPAAEKAIKKIEELGFGSFPVCMAKTQYSLSDNANLLGRPKGFRVTVREAYVSAGAGFVVALTGSIMTMPGLPKSPAAFSIDVDDNGDIVGLF